MWRNLCHIMFATIKNILNCDHFKGTASNYNNSTNNAIKTEDKVELDNTVMHNILRIMLLQFSD